MEIEPLSILLFWGDVEFFALTFGTSISLLVIIILLILSALISGSEVAYFSLSPNDRQQLSGEEDKQSGMVLENLAQPDYLLATILVTNNFVNVGIVMLSTFAMNSLVDFSQAPILGFIVQVVIVTFFLLLFGEVIPKVYAAKNAMTVAKMMSVPLFLLGKLFSPINKVLIRSTSLVNKRMQKKQSTNISVDELSHALELTDDLELNEDKEILEGIVNFGSKTAEEIMTPRVDVQAIDIADSLDHLVNVINNSGYSRIPVFEDNQDNVKGVLYIKDLLPYINKVDDFKWQEIIRPPFFVPESKKIDDLLEDFQKNKVHLAVVVDEYGGNSGIVTLEDILEEIVGDISDEFDEDQSFFTRISENKYLFDGKTLIDDFCKVTHTDPSLFSKMKGVADTLAGLILEIKGEIPKQNAKVDFENISFTVDMVDNRRIKKIKVEIK
ncbi:MAG: gliding motility-associated protein GldE [Mangrovibacterium sp.]